MSDDDTSVIMEDTISVVTSPPRKSRTGDRNLLLFSPAQGASPSISDGTRDSPLKYGSRHDSPLSLRKSGYNEPSPSGFGAPPARTSVTLSLFQPDSDVEDDGVPSPHQGLNNKATSADPADQEESLQDLLRQFSPQHPAYAQGRRFTLKPLDLNHHGLGKMEDRIIQDAPSLHRQGRPPLCRDRSTGSTETSETGEPTAVHRRKRASPERRRLDDPKTPYRRGNLFQAEPTNLSATPSMHISPHISPNSFLTIDGRFVHSKNPFSSPMMTEEDVTPRPHRTQHQMAPTFPVSFPNTDDDDDDDGAIHPARLPPRTRTSASRLSTPPSSARGALRGDRFCFTGSPIPETDELYDSAMYDSAMETDVSSSASLANLHKVRRYSREDDVVAAAAATEQHYLRSTAMYLPSSKSQPGHAPYRPSSIQTSLTTTMKSPWDGHEDISPTDVTSFPPTPAKSRREPSYPPPYARIPKPEPSTPARPHRPIHSSRTPRCTNDFDAKHNSIHNTDEDDEASRRISQSRFSSDFDIIAELGKGSFGIVYKVLSRLDGCMYAVKSGHRPAKGRADRDRMLQEVYALAALSDQADTATFHIVRYHQAWMEDDRLYIQTELCSGTLADEVARFGRPTEARRYKVMREILVALAFIHRHNMVHLDIKPENIFLKNDQFKLGDFGLVTQSSSSHGVEEGDSRYLSMELLSGDRSDLTKSDIFSLGITMYEISRYGGDGGLPMSGPLWQSLRAGKLDLPIPETGQEMTVLLHRMMNPVPEQRPAATELLKHPQLLSDEQKALNLERSKVAQANMQLLSHQQIFQPPKRKRLVRANTWNGNLSIL